MKMVAVDGVYDAGRRRCRLVGDSLGDGGSRRLRRWGENNYFVVDGAPIRAKVGLAAVL